MELQLLSEEYKGYPIHVNYQSAYVYEPVLYQQEHQFGVLFERTPLKEPMQCGFEDTLLADWLEQPFAIGAFENGKLLGFIELSNETWNKRLRISNIFVEPTSRRNSIGSALIKEAKQRANRMNVRALILETQSCNDPAIRFYIKHGFSFLGCDLYAHSNQDIENKNVRIEMIHLLSDEKKNMEQ